MPWEMVRVEARAETRIAEEPRAFELAGERREVTEILDRWLASSADPVESPQDYFRVRTAEGDVHMLRYNRIFHAWAIQTDGDGRLEA